MRNNSKWMRFVLVTILLIALASFGAALFAAEATNDAAATAAGAPALSAPAGFNPRLVQGLVALFVPMLIAVIKGWIPEDKRKWLPVVAPIVGEILAALTTNLPTGSGAVAGLAGVGVREVVDQHKGAGAAVALLIGIFGLFFVSGCGTLDAIATKTVKPASVTTVTNVIERVETNFVAVATPGATPAQTVTNIEERFVTNTVTDLRYVTNFVVDPSITTGIKTGEAIGALAPPPYNAAIIGSLGAASGLLGLLAAYKTRQSAQLAASNAGLEAAHADMATQLHATIQGVEDATAAIDRKSGDAVKTSIAKVSSILGVAEELHASVQAVTDVGPVSRLIPTPPMPPMPPLPAQPPISGSSPDGARS